MQFVVFKPQRSGLGACTADPMCFVALQVHQAQLLRPSMWAGSRRDGLVAVKIQYPDALARMLQDLVNIRVAARFLQVRARPLGSRV